MEEVVGKAGSGSLGFLSTTSSVPLSHLPRPGPNHSICRRGQNARLVGGAIGLQPAGLLRQRGGIDALRHQRHPRPLDFGKLPQIRQILRNRPGNRPRTSTGNRIGRSSGGSRREHGDATHGVPPTSGIARPHVRPSPPAPLPMGEGSSAAALPMGEGRSSTVSG